jgi:predicted dehydrogenase
MDKVKIGVIGLGGVAQLVHLPNLSKLSNAGFNCSRRSK